MQGRPKSSSNNNLELGEALETIAELQVPPVQIPNKQPDRFNRHPCVRLDWERGSPLCSLEEPRGNVLDVQRTFAPRPRFVVTPLRLAFLGLSATTLYFDISQHPKENRWIYCGYLSVWVFVMVIMYQICSLICCTWDGFTVQPIKDDKYILYSPGYLVHLTWLLFSTSVNLGLLVVILYWAFWFDGGVSFANISMHGGTLLAVLVDGFVIGKIPIRIKHIIVAWFVACLYLIWMGIQELLRLGNGDWAHEDPEDDINDDALYEQVQWRNDPYKSFFICTVIMFIVTPGLFLLTWFISFAAAGFRFNGTGYRLYEQNNEGEGGKASKKQKTNDGEGDGGTVTTCNVTARGDATTIYTHGDATTIYTGAGSVADNTTTAWTESSTQGQSAGEAGTNYVECP